MNTKTNEFFEYLNQTSLADKDKKHLMSIFSYLDGDHPPIFANRIFLFEGEPGIGKTFLAKKLISSVDKPIVFLGQTQIFDNVKRAKDLKELLNILENFNEGIVYIDDLKYVFNFTEFDDLSNADRHKFMRILESFKDNTKKTVLIMTLNDSDFMDNSWKDRIDVHITFELPSNENKLGFLKETFSQYVAPEGLNYISENTIGYNYRDLPQVLKIAYYHGEKKMNLDSIKEALIVYTPSCLSNFNIKQGIKTKLNDLFLKDDLKKELKRVYLTIKKRGELIENNAIRPNFLIFEGPAGTGKTFSAHALAGEIGIPLVKISAREFYGRRFGINVIFDRIKRFQDAIVLIDDADKLFDGDAFSLNDGGALNSDLNSHIDELDKAALVVLSVNDSRRLGRAFRDRFKIIKFENPGLEERGLYFNKIIKNSKIKFNISESDFTEVTKDMNYRDIQRLWNECIFYAIENNLKVLEKRDIISILGRDDNSQFKSTMFG
ncbi:MAG: ATP-binding protein [Nanoarchaeota archaeon]